MSKTPPFFTKKWHPWNIIILVLSILLIAVLIWGGVTDWKFIPSESSPSTPTPTPKPSNVQTMNLTVDYWKSETGAPLYGYSFAENKGSLSPNAFNVYKKSGNSSSTSSISVRAIEFWWYKSYPNDPNPSGQLTIFFSPQSFHGEELDPSYAMKFIINGKSYKFVLQNTTGNFFHGKDIVGLIFLEDDTGYNFPKESDLSDLVNKSITVQFIQN